ncbi:MAG: hypothetical protein GY719_13730 [bacterium]|nr:hypothetical protein [bacterium]
MTRTGPDRRHPRRLAAAFVLCALVGSPLAALPPGLFGGGDVCFMACSLDDRDCCCKKSAARSNAGHGPHDAATLTLPTRLCAELCATLDEARGSHKLALSESRAQLADARDVVRVATATASARRVGHDDLATLPRPPPAVSWLIGTGS